MTRPYSLAVTDTKIYIGESAENGGGVRELPYSISSSSDNSERLICVYLYNILNEEYIYICIYSRSLMGTYRCTMNDMVITTIHSFAYLINSTKNHH